MDSCTVISGSVAPELSFLGIGKNSTDQGKIYLNDSMGHD